MENRSKEIIKEGGDAAQRVLANFGSVVSAGLQNLGYLSPEHNFMAVAVFSVLSYWGDVAQKKTNDLFQQFIDNKDKMVKEIVADDKFKSVFLKIFNENITESNEEKRQLLKNYILNMACGINSDFNEHTKIINTLNNITLEEVEFLKLWDENGIVWNKQKEATRRSSYTLGDIASTIMNADRNHKLLQERFIHNQDRSNQILLSLGYNGLLYVLSERNFGSGQEARVKGITDFGKTFLDFIRY